jgi:hypothetical protein
MEKTLFCNLNALMFKYGTRLVESIGTLEINATSVDCNIAAAPGIAVAGGTAAACRVAEDTEVQPRHMPVAGAAYKYYTGSEAVAGDGQAGADNFDLAGDFLRAYQNFQPRKLND